MNKNEQFRATVIKTLDDNPEKTFNGYADELGINKYTRYDLLQQAVSDRGGDLSMYRSYLDRPDISIMNTGVPRHPYIKKRNNSSSEKKSANQPPQSTESRLEPVELDIIRQIDRTVNDLKNEINKIIKKAYTMEVKHDYEKKSSAKYYTNCLKANSDAAAKRTSKVKAKTEVEVTTTVPTEISEEKIAINSVDEMFEVFEKTRHPTMLLL